MRTRVKVTLVFLLPSFHPTIFELFPILQQNHVGLDPQNPDLLSDAAAGWMDESGPIRGFSPRYPGIIYINQLLQHVNLQ
jgi:hypothetical protein